MNGKYAKKIAFFTFTCLFSLLYAGESFRVRKVHSLNFSEDLQSEKNVSIGINDSVAVFLPQDRTFIEGLEVRIQIPQAVSSWRDSVACSIYDSITPIPKENQIDYTGTKLFLTPLPSKLSWIMKIPLKENNSIKDSQYASKIHIMPDTKDGFAFIRFQPVMKGVPEETLNATLNISVKPILINKGRLNIKIENKEINKKPEIYIDENLISNPDNILLDSGMHNLSVQSEEYRTEVRTIYIEQAKTTDINITLKSIKPTLKVSCPGNAQVFIDNKPFTQLEKEVEIEEGEHKIRFVIGGYEIIRSLSVLNGKSYTANLSIDLDLAEE